MGSMKKAAYVSRAKRLWPSAIRRCPVAAVSPKVASEGRAVNSGNIVNPVVSIAETGVIVVETEAAAAIIVVGTEVIVEVAANIGETAVAANVEARPIVNALIAEIAALVTAEIAAREIAATSALIAVAANALTVAAEIAEIAAGPIVAAASAEIEVASAPTVAAAIAGIAAEPIAAAATAQSAPEATEVIEAITIAKPHGKANSSAREFARRAILARLLPLTVRKAFLKQNSDFW